MGNSWQVQDASVEAEVSIPIFEELPAQYAWLATPGAGLTGKIATDSGNRWCNIEMSQR